MTNKGGWKTSLFRYHPPPAAIDLRIQEKLVLETGFHNQETVNSLFAFSGTSYPLYYEETRLRLHQHQRTSPGPATRRPALGRLRAPVHRYRHKPSWEKLLAYAWPGDTIVIWRLDRLGRSTKQLIEVVEDLSRRQLHLISLQDPIDTTSPGGQLVFQIFCALAEHERNVLVQRTHAGLQAARTCGR